MLFSTTLLMRHRKRLGMHDPQHSDPNHDRRVDEDDSEHHVAVRRAGSRLAHTFWAVRWMSVSDIVQGVLGVLSTLLWIVQCYAIDQMVDHSTNHKILIIQFLLSLMYIFDFVVRTVLLGLKYLWTRWALIDLLTILPIWYTMYQLNFYRTDHDEGYLINGFVQFVIDLSVVWQLLILCRFLRLFKLLRIAALRKLTFWSNNEMSRGVSQLILTVVTIVVLGGGTMYLIENNSPDGTTVTFNQAIYFLIVTISTVGYGDFSPTSILGQMTIVGIILLAIVLVPLQVSSFVDSLNEHSKHGRPYTKRRTPHVVIVTGAISSEDLDTLLNELYHSDDQSVNQFDVVLLCSCDKDHRRKLLYHVRSTKYWACVHCLIGSPQSMNDMKRAAVKRARVVFVLANQSINQTVRFVDAEHERAADEEALMRGLSIKRYCPAVPLVLSINQLINQSHVLTYLLSQFTAIQLICLNNMKMQLFGHAAVAPGIMGMLTNMLAATQHKSVSHHYYKSHERSTDSLDRFTPHALRTQPLKVDQWPLTCHRNPVNTQSVGASLTPARRWEDEYLFGLSFELFTCEFSAVVDGLTFAEATALLYERLGVVLVGLYRKDQSSNQFDNQSVYHTFNQPISKRVVLNPGYSMRISRDRGDRGVVLAHSIEQVEEVRWLDDQGRDIRARWKSVQKANHKADNQLVNPNQTTLHLSSRNSDQTFNQALNGNTFASRYSNDNQRTLNPSNEPVSPGHLNVEFLSNGQVVDILPHNQSVQLSSPPPRKTSDSFRSRKSPVSSSDIRSFSQLDIDPFTNHIVVCGYIDHHIMSFIIRVRASDHRSIVIVIDQSNETIIPFINRSIAESNIQEVYIVQGYLDDRSYLYLNYSNPCFGHCHPQVNDQPNVHSVDPSHVAYYPAAPNQSVNQPMDINTLLERSNWFRRCAVHRADVVIILANHYATGQLDSQTDGRLKADRLGLITQAALHAYIDRCKTSVCPTLQSIRHSINQSTAAQLITIELVNSVNLRLFKHDQSQIATFCPNKPRSTGWGFICKSIKKWKKNRQSTEQTNSLQSKQPTHSSYIHPCFVSSDGLSFSNQLFDSLAVRAFYQPIVHETICDLIEGQTINPLLFDSVLDKQPIEASVDSQSFRVELLLLDTPPQLVGRSFGHVQLRFMIESGWVALGLYRDRRQVNKLRRMKYRQSSDVSNPSDNQRDGTAMVPHNIYHPIDSPMPHDPIDVEMAQMPSQPVNPVLGRLPSDRDLRMTRATNFIRSTNLSNHQSANQRVNSQPSSLNATQILDRSVPPIVSPAGSQSINQYEESDDSDLDEDDCDRTNIGAAEKQSTKLPWRVRSHFYVLTNPPADTILHEKDRLYVLVQRKINEHQPVDLANVQRSDSVVVTDDRPDNGDDPDVPVVVESLNQLISQSVDQSSQVELLQQLTTQQSMLEAITKQLASLNQSINQSNASTNSNNQSTGIIPSQNHPVGGWNNSNAQSSAQSAKPLVPRPAKSRRGSGIETLDPIVGEMSLPIYRHPSVSQSVSESNKEVGPSHYPLQRSNRFKGSFSSLPDLFDSEKN